MEVPLLAAAAQAGVYACTIRALAEAAGGSGSGGSGAACFSIAAPTLTVSAGASVATSACLSFDGCALGTLEAELVITLVAGSAEGAPERADAAGAAPPGVMAPPAAACIRLRGSCTAPLPVGPLPVAEGAPATFTLRNAAAEERSFVVVVEPPEMLALTPPAGGSLLLPPYGSLALVARRADGGAAPGRALIGEGAAPSKCGARRSPARRRHQRRGRPGGGSGGDRHAPTP
jgi:hypothetical protein